MNEIKIIAEIGCNWHSIEEAKEFIRKSKELNLFATKFQCFTLEQCREAKIPEYLVLTKDNIQELFNYGQSINQEVFFTPIYPEIIEFLDKEVGVNYFKIRFKDFNNDHLLNRVIATNKCFFRSRDCGLAEKGGIFPLERTLFCIPSYPANEWDYYDNLRLCISNWGISDHSSTLNLLQIARILGIEYFERHMCLTKNCLESQWSSTFGELEKVMKP